MKFRVVFAALAMAAVSACASVPNPIDAQTRSGVFVEGADLVWNVEDGKRLENPAYVEGKADMQARLEAAVENEFKASPAGSEPVTFKIDVKNYSRVGTAMGNLIGGSNMVTADVTVIRKSDGKELGKYEDVVGMFASNGGLIGLAVQAATKPDVVGVMADSFAANLRTRFESKS